jgi:hypothetical protein
VTEIRDRRQKHWFYVDDAVIDVHANALGPFGLALYMILVRHADKNGQSFPSLSHLQKMLGDASRNTVKKYLGLLVERGLVAYTRRDDPQGDQSSHLYTLLPVSKSPPQEGTNSTDALGGGRSTSDLPLSMNDSRDAGEHEDGGVGHPMTGVGHPMTGVGHPMTYGRSTSDLPVGQLLTPKDLGFLKDSPLEGHSPPQTPPPTGEGPSAVAAEEGSAAAPAALAPPWERPAFPAPRQPWDKPVPPAIAACGLCDDHGLVDLATADGTPLTAQCVHVAGAMEAFAQHHGYQLVRRDRSRDPPTPAAGGGHGP